ncbi:hypothetical protein FF011L_40720 [Roseimaritima multifibrata]|uniref:DUF1573 domain-containing protein n=1 Tax=Roseimaritima multifibrata TaxID=1930274 RepID=A0A517MK59_9BACT|nr:DUF1573 domain-containing protein [Roseimaritima multifibrata]QDS95279.1 hypothetical protein FF011L_40720 [Roseimaritima multifibrata]
MHNLIRGALFCLLLMPCTVRGQDWARKMFPETNHDFHAVARGAKVVHHFEFENLYQEDLHVSAVRSSCGCTTPTVTKSTVGSREKSAIVATFNTSSYTGPKSATVTVVFDRPYYAEVQLTVAGNIRTDVMFTPGEADFGEVKEGTTKEIKLSVSNLNRPNWRITDVRSQCTDMLVKLSPPIQQGRGVKYDLTLSLKESMPVGEIHEQVSLVTNDPSSANVDMCVSGVVRPSLSINPGALSMGGVATKGVFERRLIVRADEPFAIKEVICPDDRFQFKAPEGKKKIHFLPLTFQAGEDAAAIAQKIRVVSDLPNDRYAEMLVTGTVVPAKPTTP